MDRCNRLILVLVIGALAAGGCTTGKFKSRPQQPDPIDLEGAWDHHLKLEEKKGRKSQRHVFIEASDIELPLSVGTDHPDERRIYSFYVWAHHPQLTGQTPLDELLKRQLQVDVIGVKARIRPVIYESENPNTTGHLLSRSAVEISVRSEDITGSFSILAWFPHDYALEQEERQGRLQKLRQELNGTTSRTPEEERLLDRIHEALNETNPWGELKAVRVYRGDLRAQIYMASRDEIEDALGPQFARFFYAGRVFFRNKHPDKSLVVYTTSLRANTYFYREPDQRMAKLINDADDDIRGKIVRARLESEIRPVSVADRSTPTGLSAADVQLLIDTTRRSATTKSPTDILESTGIRFDSLVLDRQRKEALDIIASTRHSITRLVDDIKARPEYFGWAPPASSVPEQIAKHRIGFINGVTFQIQAGTPNFDSIPGLSAAAKLKLTAEINQMVTRDNQMIRQAFLKTGSPFDTPIPLTVGTHGREAVYSADAMDQAQHASHGYIWKDYYRPMTFQSVLNSLIVSTESSVRQQVMDWLQSAGMVAGGLVGMGTIFNELTSRSYIEAVAVTTSIILPEARKRLLDDVNQYVKNLGDLGMDTVLVIPPNGVADRYIFFPRGPIFYGVDEFNINRPSFIVEIDNADVAVEATLIDDGQEVTAGAVSADTLVGRALDRGRSIRDSDQLKLTAMLEKVRTFQLTSLSQRVQDLLSKGETNSAARTLAQFEVSFGPDPTGVLDQLHAAHDLPRIRVEERGPTISELPDFSIPPNTASPTFSIELADPEGDPERLIVLAHSDNLELIPSSAIEIGGTSTVRTVRVLPNEGKSGKAEITLYVTDGRLTAKTSFVVTVTTGQSPAPGPATGEPPQNEADPPGTDE